VEAVEELLELDELVVELELDELELLELVVVDEVVVEDVVD
jgi:hypothetical protein